MSKAGLQFFISICSTSPVVTLILLIGSLEESETIEELISIHQMSKNEHGVTEAEDVLNLTRIGLIEAFKISVMAPLDGVTSWHKS